MHTPMRFQHGATRRMRRGIFGGIIVVALISTSFVGTGGAAVSTDADPAVLRDWNATMVATVVVDAGKANAEAFYWFGIVQPAMYNAVVGITRGYELYEWSRRGPAAASPEAAAAQAAHDVLLHYFPASKARLDTQLAASLAGVADGSAEQQGIKYGAAAADHAIALRANDGRFDTSVTYDDAPGPGVWEPAPPATAFFDPWLSEVDPLLMTSPEQFRPGPPPSLTSAQYTAEFNEVKETGSKTGSTRTPLMTETALFFSDTAIGSFQAALRDLTLRRGMDISEAARVFAAVNMSVTDSIIASWDAKIHYAFWRPVMAINRADTDGNPDTTLPETTWEPLVPNPPYPDHTSGLNSVVGAYSRTLTRLGAMDLFITSVAAGGVTRHYTSATTFNQDAMDARVWGGLHFRTADVYAIQTATKIADWGLDHYFRPS